MKKTGLLHAELSRVIAAMGHRDLLVIGDAGLPIPVGVSVVDLALRPGVPTFLETLDTVLGELHVEEAVIDTELASASPTMHADFLRLWPEAIALRDVPHAEFQLLAGGARAIVRTGECTAYSNIALYAGVIF